MGRAFLCPKFPCPNCRSVASISWRSPGTSRRIFHDNMPPQGRDMLVQPLGCHGQAKAWTPTWVAGVSPPWGNNGAGGRPLAFCGRPHRVRATRVREVSVPRQRDFRIPKQVQHVRDKKPDGRCVDCLVGCRGRCARRLPAGAGFRCARCRTNMTTRRSCAPSWPR